jgi:site-specific DNA-methyltransferase (adenine-specific)
MSPKIALLPKTLDPAGRNIVVQGPAGALLSSLLDESIQLIYVDPPFNTGVTQRRVSRTTKQAIDGERTGFGGRKYTDTVVSNLSYTDTFADYEAFLRPLLVAARAKLKATGTLYLHIDYREVHYVKVMLDTIFGRENFLNEIIWAYDYGGRTTKRWPAKHDNILVYARDAKKYLFNSTEVDREPYMAPGLVTPEKVAKGKLPTDVWWHTIVPTNGREKTGYPTQKPEGILRRIITASCGPGDVVLDFFGGSGTTAAVAGALGRHFVTCDNNPQALAVMKPRLKEYQPTLYRVAKTS